MVDIVVGGIPPIHTNQGKRDSQRRGPGKKPNKDRRKNQADRRQSVRDGILVTLSDRSERRRQPDRRRGSPKD